jgi:hypothetical protein
LFLSIFLCTRARPRVTFGFRDNWHSRVWEGKHFVMLSYSCRTPKQPANRMTVRSNASGHSLRRKGLTEKRT